MEKPTPSSPAVAPGAPAKVPASAGWQDSVWPQQEPEPPVIPLTRDEAQALIARSPSLSPWRVIALQALIGVVVAVIWGGLSRNLPSFISALYGAAVVVVPGALMVRGVFGRGAGRSSLGGLLFWEIVKLALVVALLALAPTWVPSLNWAALLVTLVLCLKVNGLVLLWQGSKKSRV
ncbi:MAG TPA: ATP synthase subunit I [Candidatus Aquabacterium excrementipullorum]|nr:ATP synthase subunit I [Candidatus Aquabacterium excrementipullorum]